MNPPDVLGPDTPLDALLAEYHEALLAGRTPTIDPSSLPPERRVELERIQDCLRLLDEDRRQRSETAPATAGHIGRFQLRRELGSGSYGTVFLAFDPVLRRDVAVKVPHLRTALAHPNIVPVHEAGEADGACYIVSAYCPGPTLALWLKRRPHLTPPRTAAAIVARLADAVAHAHERGVLHRDLKPGNVLIEGGDDSALVPKITDFGLAKLLHGEEESTRSGALLGTPSYMAPEQAEGRLDEVGPAADVYGLGAILYEILTERPPFKGATTLQTLEQVHTEAPLPPSRLHAGLPRDLETICLKCLNKEPGQRYASAAELRDDLLRFIAGEPVRARPLSPWVRLEHWSRRPDQIRNAGLVMFTVAVVLAIFCVLGLSLIAVGGLRAPNPQLLLTYGLFSLFGVHGPMAFLGWRTMHHRRGALPLGLLASLAFAGFGTWSTLDTFNIGWGDINRSERLLVDVPITIVAWMSALAHVIAVRAYFHNRDRLREKSAGDENEPRRRATGLG